MNKEITNLKIENLKEFKGHPYKVVDDWNMVALTESIRKSGIITPIVVRPIDDTENYEIISGHRRIFAAKKAGLSIATVNKCIRHLSDAGYITKVPNTSRKYELTETGRKTVKKRKN